MGKKIAGIVLAGGKSSRMGENKALLDYNGRPLLDHMIGILEQTGLSDIYVSGAFEGYRCIPDSAPHAGPAQAIADIFAALDDYAGALFIPVDMPLLPVDALHLLLAQKRGAYFEGAPLPAFIAKPHSQERFRSVKEILAAGEIKAIALPPEFESCMGNANTPEEWQKVSRA